MSNTWLECTFCRALCGVAAIVALAVTVSAQQQSADPSVAPASVTADRSTPHPELQQRNPRYQLRAGDVLDLQFEFSPEFNQTVAVQPDGYISVRGVGDLHVAGDTVPELTKALQQQYGKFLHDPVIAVVLKEFEKPYFIASGMVGRPGKYDLRGDTTVVEAIAMAGGFTEASKHSQVVLYRRVSQEWLEAKLLDVKSMLNNHNLREDIHLQPGDMIYVPQNRISKIRRYIPSTGLSVTPPVM
jgi:polysaccharide biosynthesis/export protein